MRIGLHYIVYCNSMFVQLYVRVFTSLSSGKKFLEFKIFIYPISRLGAIPDFELLVSNRIEMKDLGLSIQF